MAAATGYVVGVGFGVARPDRRAGHHAGLVLDLLRRHLPGGLHGAYVQSYRFAAADTAEDALKAKAISWVMVGSRGCHHRAAVGDLHARRGSGHAHVGSFLSQALLPLIALPILLMRARRARPRPKPPPTAAARCCSSWRCALRAGVRAWCPWGDGVRDDRRAGGDGQPRASVDNAAPGHPVAPAGDVRAELLHWAADGALRQGARDRRGHGAARRLRVAALGGLGLSHFWARWRCWASAGTSASSARRRWSPIATPAERSKAQGMNDFVRRHGGRVVPRGSIPHSSGWQAVNWMIFPALALIWCRCCGRPRESRCG